MPKKTPVTFREAIHFNFHEILKVIDLSDINLIEEFEGEKKRDFLKFCSETYANPFFKEIMKHFIFKQVMLTSSTALNGEQITSGQLMCEGIMTVNEYFLEMAKIYEQMFNTPDEQFDKRASFNKAKI